MKKNSYPVLTAANAEVGKRYAFCDGWMQVSRIYRIPEEYAAEHGLLTRWRFTATLDNDDRIDAALPS